MVLKIQAKADEFRRKCSTWRQTTVYQHQVRSAAEQKVALAIDDRVGMVRYSYAYLDQTLKPVCGTVLVRYGW